MKYLNYLANEEHMPLKVLISYCGGTSKASEIKHMIAAYQDVQQYYRPLCDDDTMFNIDLVYHISFLKDFNYVT